MLIIGFVSIGLIVAGLLFAAWYYGGFDMMEPQTAEESIDAEKMNVLKQVSVSSQPSVTADEKREILQALSESSANTEGSARLTPQQPAPSEEEKMQVLRSLGGSQ